MSTWEDANWPGQAGLGFFQTHGGGQTRAAWEIRGKPQVKVPFAKIWNDSDLLTSMDTFICWRPWWLTARYQSENQPNQSDNKTDNKTDNNIDTSSHVLNTWEDWEPRVERIHCDQNPKRRPGFHCVQGMVTLLPAQPSVGGLQVVPDTHTDEIQHYLLDKVRTTMIAEGLLVVLTTVYALCSMVSEATVTGFN